jgi:hypothetical protein
MKQRVKKLIVERLAGHLAQFDTKLSDQFVCPTCLAQIPTADLGAISEAHIVPEAAGGSLSTLLCRKCNSDFGSKQDRWFGDYVRMRREKKDPVEANKANHFEIDGVRYGGTVVADRSRGIEFTVYSNLTSPEALRELQRRSKHEGFNGAKVTVRVPLTGNKHLIDVGFVTAGYLLWFHELGYSWVLQDHLAQVREQIQNPGKEVLSGRYVVRCPDRFFERPSVGVIRHEAGTMPVAAIADMFVCVPSFDRPRATFADIEEGPLVGDYRPLRLYHHHNFGSPIGLAFQDRCLVMPDVLLQRKAKGFMAYYPAFDAGPVRMEFVLDEEYERRCKLPGAHRVSLKCES